MKKSLINNRILCSLVLSLLVIFMCSCSEKKPSQVVTPVDNNEIGVIVYGSDSYDSADTPILIKKDTEKGTMTFYNREIGKSYTLEYDGTTGIYDKYGKTLSLPQIEVGDLVDVKFIKSKKHLTSISLSPEAWTIEDTNRYIINPVKKEITIGEDTYKISSEARFFSGDKEISLQDIVETDTLSFQGVDSNIYSVVVTKGHGYLRLTGQQSFVGGWIEIGNSLIQKVTEDMLFTVSEGSYQVKISYGGTVAEKSVKINRNSESTIDFSDVVFEEAKTGTILFSVTPSKAEVFIDAEKIDTSEAITLTYGLHQLICRAEGYTTITQYLNVGQEKAGITIELEKNNDSSDDKKEEDNTEKKDESNSDSVDTTNTTSTYYKMYFDAPEGVEVYVDGAYVGLSPCSMKKSSGSHVVSLSKEGYVTKSYTINVDSEDRDVSFSFVELVAN